MRIYTSEAHVAIVPVRSTGSMRFVTVFLGKQNLRVRRNFRCVNCGRVVFQYNGDIGMIYDGATEPLECSDTEIMCKRCKIVFRVI